MRRQTVRKIRVSLTSIQQILGPQNRRGHKQPREWSLTHSPQRRSLFTALYPCSGVILWPTAHPGLVSIVIILINTLIFKRIDFSEWVKFIASKMHTGKFMGKMVLAGYIVTYLVYLIKIIFCWINQKQNYYWKLMLYLLNLWRSMQIQQVTYRTSICSFGFLKYFLCMPKFLTLHLFIPGLGPSQSLHGFGSSKWQEINLEMSDECMSKNLNYWGKTVHFFKKSISKKTFGYTPGTRNNFKLSLILCDYQYYFKCSRQVYSVYKCVFTSDVFADINLFKYNAGHFFYDF